MEHRVVELEKVSAATGVRMYYMEQDLAEVKADVKVIRTAMEQTKGGWRALVAIGAIAGALGAFVAKLLPWLTIAPR